MAKCPGCEFPVKVITPMCPQCGFTLPGQALGAGRYDDELGDLYGKTGLIVAIVTALFFLKFDYWALSLLGITAGLVARDWWISLRGVLVSVMEGFLFMIFTFTLTRFRPMGPNLFHGLMASEYFFWMCGVLVGVACQMPPRLRFFTFVSCTLNLLNLVIISAILHAVFIRWLVVWEYLTLLSGVGAMGCTWWLVDFVDGRFHLGIDGKGSEFD